MVVCVVYIGFVTVVSRYMAFDMVLEDDVVAFIWNHLFL